MVAHHNSRSVFRRPATSRDFHPLLPNIMFIAIALSLVAAATARSSYIALPADQITFVDLSKVHVRLPRQTLTPPQPPPPTQTLNQLYEDEYMPIPIQGVQQYQQIPIQQYQHQPLNFIPIGSPNPALQQQQQDLSGSPAVAAPAQDERPPDFGEYVDFGAHTGDNGAFGWYADYPVNGHVQESIGFR